MKVIAQWDDIEKELTISDDLFKQGFFDMVVEAPPLLSASPCKPKPYIMDKQIRLYDTGQERNNMRIYAPL